MTTKKRRHWSEIPTYEWQDPNWGVEGCDSCGEYEGDSAP
jgi:hypothetical protein